MDEVDEPDDVAHRLAAAQRSAEVAQRSAEIAQRSAEVAQRRVAELEAQIQQQRRLGDAVFDAVDVGLVLSDRTGRQRKVNRQHREFQSLGFPDGHHGEAGQTGFVYTEDLSRPLTREEMPSWRARSGEQFDNVVIWAGEDPKRRRALSVSSRVVRDADGGVVGSALAYKDVTELLRAMQVKDEFVASVSHELRTPLTSVLGHLELMTDRDDLPAGLEEQLAAVERNAVRLRQLVHDLLDVAQGTEGQLTLNPQEVDAAALVREATEVLRWRAETAGLSLDVEAPRVLTTVLDPHRFRQVIDNLVANAIKYTPEGGVITVVLRDTGAGIELSVADTGIGIAADEIDLVLERFYRAREATDRQIPGTGLGLAIVQQVVEADGGEVTIASDGPGAGTTVRVVVPRAEV